MADPLPLAIKQRAGVFASIALIIFLTLLSTFTSPAGAAKSLVTVYSDNEERAISTTVLTVGEALERSGVELGPHDLVEPGIDTFINEAVFRINVYRARPVTVVDGTSQIIVMSPYQSPRLIAESAGLDVYDEDKFSFELIDDILLTGALGQRLIIERSTPVTLSLYGDIVNHRTHATTVGEVLGEVGFVLSTDDQMNKKSSDVIVADSRIEIVRVGTTVVVEDVIIPHSTDYIYNSNMFSGQSSVKAEGTDGVKIVTYEIDLENGVEVGRRELQSVEKVKPVTEVRVVGTKVADPSSNVSIGRSLAAGRGWVDDQWQCLYSLWVKESQWNHLAENPYSGAYGIPQSLPASKMATAGADYLTNPATQISWGLSYIGARYGTPCGAWNHSVINNWY